MLADTVKDPREQIQLLGASLLGLAARECLPIAQLACYAGAFEDLFSVAESGGGAEGSAASGALEAAEALLEGAATNRAHFVANNGDKNVLASRLCALLSVDSSDELVLTDAKAASLAAACRVVLALRESGPALSSLLCPVLSRLALGRVPAQKVRALALWALASALPPRLVEGGFVLDEARAVRVALRASPLEASAAAALLAAWWSRVPQGAALALPESPVSLLARAAWGAHNATAEESATSCWFACLALCGVARAGEAILSAAHALLAGVSARDPMMALGRLRLALRFVSDNAQFAGALLRAGALGPLVEALLGPSSSPHVAAAAGALLRSLAGHDRPACDVLLRRVGPDKFLAPFRAVLRSKEWQEGKVFLFLVFFPLLNRKIRIGFER